MYSDSESDDAAYDGILDSDDEPVNKSDSDFDFITQGDEDDGEIDFDAELSTLTSPAAPGVSPSKKRFPAKLQSSFRPHRS